MQLRLIFIPHPALQPGACCLRSASWLTLASTNDTEDPWGTVTKAQAMTPVDKLLAIEEIKRLKSKYFWGLDHKNWEFWQREVWAPDARLIVPEASRDCVGIEAILAYVRESTADQVSVHHGHMPNIEIT